MSDGRDARMMEKMLLDEEEVGLERMRFFFRLGGRMRELGISAKDMGQVIADDKTEAGEIRTVRFATEEEIAQRDKGQQGGSAAGPVPARARAGKVRKYVRNFLDVSKYSKDLSRDDKTVIESKFFYGIDRNGHIGVVEEFHAELEMMLSRKIDLALIYGLRAAYRRSAGKVRKRKSRTRAETPKSPEFQVGQTSQVIEAEGQPKTYTKKEAEEQPGTCTNEEIRDFIREQHDAGVKRKTIQANIKVEFNRDIELKTISQVSYRHNRNKRLGKVSGPVSGRRKSRVSIRKIDPDGTIRRFITDRVDAGDLRKDIQAKVKAQFGKDVRAETISNISYAHRHGLRSGDGKTPSRLRKSGVKAKIGDGPEYGSDGNLARPRRGRYSTKLAFLDKDGRIRKFIMLRHNEKDTARQISDKVMEVYGKAVGTKQIWYHIKKARETGAAEQAKKAGEAAGSPVPKRGHVTSVFHGKATHEVKQEQ